MTTKTAYLFSSRWFFWAIRKNKIHQGSRREPYKYKSSGVKSFGGILGLLCSWPWGTHSLATALCLGMGS